ncbi:MAG TPA: glucosamine-6-phosphate deaminase [Micrococcales bacterium]|uniref:Glucosamine-6-phosphate deaminase n=1 Tax=Miniimonas arenae TaxID=676201 RepID=A0A5C5BGG7_9MICO|nr:glucosamine-6-phosphate deaminase [Miniimonas arenae]TNU76535.1 glucosamine-6-phosphate deaminase [Miniimonas arenae]HCX86315.1 glucosamine-6-phosphate deaminase [Micrococcales bacterium]
MEVIVVERPEDAAPIVADAYSRLLAAKPDAVLGLATGSTPLGVYDELVRRYEAGELTFASARAFLLDEYVGLPADHPERYRAFIERVFTGRVDLRPDAVQGPDGLAEDLSAAGVAYDAAIREAGGIDLQILGIGADGHLAFNMPMSSLTSRTRLKTLTPKTRLDNARFFDDDLDQVPRHCLTQGLGTIMESRHAVMLGFGLNKAQAVRECVEGAVSARWPASVLQLHPHATVVVDAEAASQLTFREYYRTTYDGKPDWQGI